MEKQSTVFDDHADIFDGIEQVKTEPKKAKAVKKPEWTDKPGKEPKEEPKAVFGDGIFEVLGYGANSIFVWSEYKQTLYELSNSDLNETTLLSILSPEFIKKHFLIVNYGKSGQVYEKVDMLKLKIALITESQKKGFFESSKSRGMGVWKNGDHLIINSKTLFSTDPKFNNKRIQEYAVYLKAGDLGIDENTPIATSDDLLAYKNVFKRYNFSRGEQDQKLIMGWNVHAYFAGALSWRTHANITGPAGSGKSTIQQEFQYLQGKNMILVDAGSTEAGIRQAMQCNAGIVAKDEAESNRQKMAQHLETMRSASSGAEVVKGTAEQKSKSYQLRFCGLLTGIVPPILNRADRSRFLLIEMKEIKKEKGKKFEFIKREKLEELGKKIFMYCLSKHEEYFKLLEMFRDKLEQEVNARYADTFSSILAGAYLIDGGDITDKNIEAYLKTFNFEKEIEQNDTKDEDELLHTFLDKIMDCQNEFSQKLSLMEILRMYYSKKADDKFINKYLSMFGIRLERDEEHNINLLVNTKAPNFNSFFKNTKFDNGNVAVVFPRLPNVKILKEAVKIGGKQTRNCLEIKIDRNDLEEDVVKKVVTCSESEDPFNNQ